MNAPQFTPGPWYLTGEDDRRYIREEASDACIALMLDGGHVDPKFAMPEREIAANANLIAAAPDLYEELAQNADGCSTIIALLQGQPSAVAASLIGLLSIQEQGARAALVRARGEQVQP